MLAAYEWLFAPPGLVPPSWDPGAARATLAALLGAPDGELLVARGAGGIEGICTVVLDLESVRFGRRAWVEDLAVAPGRRSAGVGKALLDMAKAWARGRGATHLELDSGEGRADAHRFYDREGAVRSVCFGWTL